MSKKIRGVRLLGAPFLLTALGASLAGGCSAEDLDPTSCKAEISARAEALQVAADALIEVSGQMKVSVGTACRNLAVAGGDTSVEEITAESSDDDLQAACAKAEAAITAQLSAAGSVSLTVEGGKCTVAASAQLSCEASCDVSGECNPGSIEARCTPGELSVSCEGTCAGGATCEGSAEVAADCQGTCEGACEGTVTGGCEGSCQVDVAGACEGTCEGTCDGTCSAMDGQGNCVGTCEGTCTGKCGVTGQATCEGTCTKPAASATCTGKCTGSCKLDANAEISCGANVKCKGECNGTASLPECRATIEPPECNLDADCQAGCEGQASIQAECTPPKVIFNFEGEVDAEFVAALEANLPAFLNVLAQGELVLDAAGDVVVKFGEVVVSVAALPGCVAKFGADLTAKAQASVAASASVSVSVNASASASGSASGGS